MYEPGIYVKGELTRKADTARDAVQAVFDGFKRSDDADVEVPAADDAVADEAPQVEHPVEEGGVEPSAEASATQSHSSSFPF